LKEYGIRAGYDAEIIVAVVGSIQGYLFFLDKSHCRGNTLLLFIVRERPVTAAAIT